LLQSTSYISSAACVRTYPRRTTSLALLARGYVVMGVLAALALPFIWPAADIMPPARVYAWPVFADMLYCVIGQAFMFITLRFVEASRVSPLLSLKILILALGSLAFGVESYSALQWTGIGLSVGAAFLLCRAGGRVPLKAIAGILLTCAFFAISDSYTKRLFDIFLPSLPFTHASILITLLFTAVGGVFGALALPFTGGFPRRMWSAYALPFGLTWLAAMLFLSACFGMIGIVHGNIAQSFRGLISIGIGYLVARAGLVEIEERVSRGTLLRRVAAALLMVLSVALFSAGVKERPAEAAPGECDGGAAVEGAADTAPPSGLEVQE
jgi:drug/metabolite transporter (DMT)-like permease